MGKEVGLVILTAMPPYSGRLFTPIKGEDMHKIDLKNFYVFGGNIHPLIKLRANIKIGDALFILVSAKGELDELLLSVELDKLPSKFVMPIRVNKKVIKRLASFLERLLRKHEEDRSAIILDDEARELRRLADEFEHVLWEVLDRLEAYYVPQRAAYDTTALIGNGEKLIPEECIKHISDYAKDEIGQAGRCIAFDLPSAAGFHLVKALEDVVHTYYHNLTGRLGPKNVGLGEYINLIQDAHGPGKVSSALRYITNNYRNKLIHQMDLSMSQAMALLGLTQNAIIVMVEDIKKKMP